MTLGTTLRRLSLTALVVTSIQVVGVVMPSTCYAQATDSERETARSLMDEGDRLLAVSDVEGALKRYQAAHQIMGVPTTGLEVARTQAKLGKLVEARAVAIEVANSAAAPREPSVFGEARSEASKLAEQLEARIPSVVITIAPEGVTTAVAKLEETRLPQAALGLPFKVNPGDHTLEVSAEGFLPQTVPFSVMEGEQRGVAITLSPSPTKPRPVASTPEAKPPDARAPADAGESSANHTTTYIAFGVAGAAALVGGGAGVYSLVKTKDAKKHCTGSACTEAARPLINDAKTYAWVANIGLGVAVLAAGYGTYNLLFGDDTPDDTSTGSPRERNGRSMSVALVPQLDGASLLCTGAF